MIMGRINSCQSFGTVDGPGIRYIVFMQGCPLSCPYCHNPETQNRNGGFEITATALLEKILPFSHYFGKDGGVTISGGEPLLQPEFLCELLTLLKENKIHSAIDTAGCLLNDEIKKALTLCDLVLLDIKMSDETKYIKHIGIEMSSVISFLEYSELIKKPVWIRYVAIPGINDSNDDIIKLKAIIKKYKCIEKTEILPFKKLCIEKYNELNRPFLYKDIPQMTEKRTEELMEILEN